MRSTSSSVEALGPTCTQSYLIQIFLSSTNILLTSSSPTLLLQQIPHQKLPSVHQHLPHIIKNYNLATTSKLSNSFILPPTSSSPLQAIPSCLKQPLLRPLPISRHHPPHLSSTRVCLQQLLEHSAYHLRSLTESNCLVDSGPLPSFLDQLHVSFTSLTWL